MTPALTTTVRRALQLLDAQDVRRVCLLLVLTLFTAAIEVLGIGSVAPFIAVLTDPEIASTNPYLKLASERFDINEPQTLLLALAGVVVGISLVRNCLFLFHQWLSSNYLALFKHNISSRLLRTYVSQPYQFFLSHSTVELQRNVTEESTHVVDGVLQPIITGLTKAIMCLTIIIFLVYLKPIVALVTLIVLGGFYGTIYVFVHRRLASLSAKRRWYRSQKFKQASEGLNGIKPLILTGQQHGYVEEFARTSLENARASAKGDVISKVPRYVIETIALVGLIAYAVIEFNLSGGQSEILPLMALYLLAGYRLLPAMQAVYGSISRIKFDSASLNGVHDHLFFLPQNVEDTDERTMPRLSDEISLNNVTYTYEGASAPAISDANLSIAANGSIALVGRSGSGKSTLVDLILGLIQPQTGEVLVDGLPLPAIRRQWQRQIGYVPQQVYLADDSVARNIAFGIDPADINHDAVRRAATIANIHDHVVNELSDGYDTIIGERGVKLSGGQCQRIGIARALYLDPSVLVLDEATSALDRVTESAIMESIRRIGQDVTVILIAHRISTVEACDWIYILSEGRLVGEGTYQSLLSESSDFRDLALSDTESSEV